MNEKELQNAMVLYQLLQSQFEQLKQQGALLQAKGTEVEATRMALEELKGLKEGNEVLLPLGSGIYTSAKHHKAPKLLVDVGAGTMLRKPPETALKVIEGKKKEIESLSTKLQEQMIDVVNKINALSVQLQEAMEKQRK